MDTNLRTYMCCFGDARLQILEEMLAPETIYSAARRSGRFKVIVCTKTLYNYIDQRLLKTQNYDLLLKLRRKPSVHRDRQHKNCSV